jgi:glycosyltransferase involved in cell wall biosynthesis
VKILWVKPGKLLPLDTGGKLRTYNILRHLSSIHDVTYLSYYGGALDQAYEQEVVQQLPGTITAHAAISDASGFGRFLDYLRRLPLPVPYSVSKFTKPQVRQMVADWISQGCFDVAVCDFLASTANFPRNLATPTALFQHNVESLLWSRRARLEVRWLDRLIAKIECAKMNRYEPAQVRRFHHILAVSEQDRHAMAGMVDPARISVIPTGVDLAKYRYDPKARAAAPLVVFTGSMDWAPNIDGVEYFCKEIWPRVLAQAPQARFRIVGRDPHARVQKLACASVEITGSVSSIADHLSEATVVVVPLRIGGGTRIKIYEGMAMGKATVSTPLGAEGLDVHHGRDILLAEDPRQFAEHVVRLLCDEEARRKYEAAAAATAQKYDWSVITERLIEALYRTVRDASAATVVSEQIAANV